MEKIFNSSEPQLWSVLREIIFTRTKGTMRLWTQGDEDTSSKCQDWFIAAVKELYSSESCGVLLCGRGRSDYNSQHLSKGHKNVQSSHYRKIASLNVQMYLTWCEHCTNTHTCIDIQCGTSSVYTVFTLQFIN